MNYVKQTNITRVESARAGAISHTVVRFLTVVAAIFVVGALLPSIASAQSSPSTSSLIVKLADGLSVDQQAAAVARNGGIEKSTIPALHLHVIEVSSEQLDATLTRYKADPQVLRAEINNARKSDAVPSDPLYSQQWSLPRIGWDAVFGSAAPSASVVVAVLDTGIDAAHPDLGGNVIAGTSMLDGSNGMTDPNGHGTRVAGIVAARTNATPAEGIAGVAYAGVHLMPVTVLNPQGLGQDSDVIAGVMWAADNGADVIVMAFSNPDFSESLQEAIDYAWSKDLVLVAAVGNDGVNAPSFPAGDRGVMGISATDSNDQLASFSNSGASVFLAAPGTSILTTDLGATYSTMSGTSSSAAIVAGAAAQLWTFDPTLTNGIIIGRLARTADPAGTQDQIGNGRINFGRAAADAGTDFIQPAGSVPVGNGGPFVGPYTAAATNVATITSLNAISNPLSSGQTNVSFAGNVSRQSVADPPIPSGGTVQLQFKAGTNCNGSVNVVTTVTNNAAGNFSGTFTAPIAAGSYSYQAQYQGAGQGSGGNAINWQKSNSLCQTISVNALSATTLTVAAASGTYAGSTTLSATLISSGSGVSGKTISFTLNGSSAGSATTNASGVATLSGVSLAGINAGTYPSGVAASFAGDASFQASNGTNLLTVAQASSTTVVTCPSSVTYTGSAQTPCTASVTGIGLSLTPTPTYSNNANAGTATASASFAGDANHTGSSDSKNFAVNQASSTTAVICPASVPYTGSPQTPCTASVTGVALNLSPTPTYANNTNAGTASASYTFAGDTNHTGSSDSKNFTIDKANTTTSVVSSLNPATADDNVSFTATVTSGASGTVQFAVNGLSYGSPVPVSSGTAAIAFTNKSAGTYTVSATYSGDANYNGSTGNLSPDQVVKAGSPAKLAFGVQPTDTQAGAAITPAVTVRVLDVANNLVTTDTSMVTIAISAGGVLHISSTTGVAAIGGVATFTNLKPTKAGSFTLHAIDETLTAADSGSFNVTPGAAVTFAFDVPASISAGQSFDIAVYAKDAFNNIATGYTGIVHFSSTDAHATLPPDTPFAAADGGVKMLTLAAVLKTAGNQTLTAADTVTSSITGTSPSILVNPGNATLLVVTAPAAVETAGVPFDVTVEAQDAYGNTATGYIGPIHFNISDPKATPPSDYTFVTASDKGIHTFSATLHSAGQWTVKATDVPSMFYGVSGTITVQPGPPAKLAFQTQPGNSFVDVALADFTVEVRDADDNVVNSSTGNVPITIAIANNPRAATLTGTATVNAVNGVATFSGLTLNKAATGYTLVASSDTLTAAPSNPFDVGKGTATLSLSNLSHTYDGSPKSATVTATPLGLSGVSVTYDGSSTAPTNAGSYAVVASLDNLDYQATNATGTLTIDKATSTTTVTFEAGPYTYHGTAFTATAKVTGVGGLDNSVAVVYAGDCTNVTSANGCTATASFGGDNNHFGSNDTKSITITKASSTTAVTFETGPYVYRGTAFTATAKVTGVGGLDSPVDVVYSGDCTHVTVTDGCTATATFIGDTNHLGSTDHKSITLTKAASTATVTFEAGPYTYRATPFTATATVTGIGGLNSPVDVIYGGDCTNVTISEGCTATATFAGDTNHLGSTDHKSITMIKASSTTTVIFEAGPYTYRATTFTATATVTGIGGLNSPAAVTYSGDCINVTSGYGCTATATFAGDTNHLGSTDHKSITIIKASSTTTVTFEAGPYMYRATAFTATAAVTGVGGLSPVGVVYSGDCVSVTTANGCTATANFAGDGNHQPSGDSKSITITRAGSTTVVTVAGGINFTYDGAMHPAAVVVTGVNLNLTPAPMYSCGHAPIDVADSGCTASFSFGGDTNHTGSSDSKTYTIGARLASVKPNNAAKFSGKADPPLTGTLTGFVATDGVTATYTRAFGETVVGSPYAITGALTATRSGALANYSISNNTGSFYVVDFVLTGPVGPLANGTAATVTANFANTGTQAGPMCKFDWDDTTTTPNVAATIFSGNWTCVASRTFAGAGVYEVKVTVTDAYTGTTTAGFQYVVIYDATAGFVTGGGWVNSPPGAYVANPAMVGKANFGFVSKYNKGQSTPTGETEFQFSAANFDFHSTLYDWLVIAGSKAQYKGSGTINGSGDYAFMLTATDGKANNGGGVDKFRIKIWNKTTSAIVYDNAPGPDDIDTSNQMSLGGGSITIHK